MISFVKYIQEYIQQSHNIVIVTLLHSTKKYKTAIKQIQYENKEYFLFKSIYDE